MWRKSVGSFASWKRKVVKDNHRSEIKEMDRVVRLTNVGRTDLGLLEPWKLFSLNKIGKKKKLCVFADKWDYMKCVLDWCFVLVTEKKNNLWSLEFWLITTLLPFKCIIRKLNHLSNFLFKVLSFATCDQWVFVDFPTWDHCSDLSPAGRWLPPNSLSSSDFANFHFLTFSPAAIIDLCMEPFSESNHDLNHVWEPSEIRLNRKFS